MEEYKRGSHTVWDCKYHLVWVTKYRYAVLGGDVGQHCRELMRETARARDHHSCRVDQPRPCASASVDPAEPVSVSRGAVPEGKKFA
jgi:putative transposase